MLNWNRWWIRLAVVYMTSALSLMLAVQIELTAVSLHWADAWLDTPMFFDLRSLLAVALTYPVVVAPVFALAEVGKQIRRRPLPLPSYHLHDDRVCHV